MKESSNPISLRASGQTRAQSINTHSVYLSRPGSKPGAGQSCRFLFWEAVGFRGRLPRQRWLDWGHCATALCRATSSASRAKSPRLSSVPSLPNLYLKCSVQAGSESRAVTPSWLGPAESRVFLSCGCNKVMVIGIKLSVVQGSGALCSGSTTKKEKLEPQLRSWCCLIAD